MKVIGISNLERAVGNNEKLESLPRKIIFDILLWCITFEFEFLKFTQNFRISDETFKLRCVLSNLISNLKLSGSFQLPFPTSYIS